MNNDQNKEQEMTEDEIMGHVVHCVLTVRLVPEIPRILHERFLEMVKDEDEATALQAYMMIEFIESLYNLADIPHSRPNHDRSERPFGKKEEKVVEMMMYPPTEEIWEMLKTFPLKYKPLIQSLTQGKLKMDR